MPSPQIQSQNPGPQPSQDFDLIRQLLGGGQELNSVPGKELAQQPGLQNIATPTLLNSSNAAQQGGNMDVMRLLRGLVEQRTPDQVARGQGPQGAKEETNGRTTAEREQSVNPFKILSDALFGANNGLNPPQ